MGRVPTYYLQQTIREQLRFVGICLHSGKPAEAVIVPAQANSGIVFRSAASAVRADANFAQTNALTTTLKGSDGWAVHTVEHIMAALAAYRVDNAIVRLPGVAENSSIPILDGSANAFAIGLAENVVPAADSHGSPVVRKRVVVEQTVEVEDGQRYARLSPLPEKEGLELDVTIDYESRISAGAGGRQRAFFYHSADGCEGGRSFREQIAPARTFCFEGDIAEMRDRGLIRGGSLLNAVVFSADDGSCITPGGLRFDNEPARHKLLDSLGDIALSSKGALCARYEAERPGHDLNRRVLVKLLGDPKNFSIATYPLISKD